MVEIWEPLDRLSSGMKDAQEAPSEQYARLKWKVARDFCRYNWKWPFTAYGPTFNVISPVQQKTRSQCAKVERRLCRIATRVYAVAATKRVTSNCRVKSRNCGASPSTEKEFHDISTSRNEIAVWKVLDLSRSIVRYVSSESVLQHLRSAMIIFYFPVFQNRFSLSSLIIHSNTTSQLVSISMWIDLAALTRFNSR